MKKLIPIVSLLLAANAAHAQSTWNSASSTWNTAGNWTPNGVPASGSTTALTFGGTTNYTATDNISGVFQLNSITFSNTALTNTVAANAGSSLEFVSNGPTTPVINLSTTPGSGFASVISANTALTNNLSITAASNLITKTALTLSGVVSGSGALTVLSGNGNYQVLLSNGSNTYSGGTFVGNGTLGGGLATSASGALGTGTITLNNGKWNTTTSAQTFSNNITVSSGLGTIDAQQNLTLNGTVNLNAANNSLLTLRATANNGTATINGAISGSGGIVRSDANGTWVLANTGNSYTGSTRINGGVLSISSIANIGSNSSLGAPTTTANGLVIIGNGNNTSTLLYTGTGHTTNRTIQVGSRAGAAQASTDTGGATIQNNGNGTMTFTAATFNTADTSVIASSVRVLTLSGSNTGLNTIQGGIQNNGAGVSGTAAVALTKDGAGTWVLSGNNTYSGTTTVSAGTLLINGVNNGGGGFNVNTGTLGGNGTISGTVNIGATTGILAPGNSPGNSPGILSTGNLSISGILSVEINGVTVGSLYDQVNVTGTVNLVSGNTLTLALGYTPTNGTNFFLINNDGADAIVGTLNGYAQGDTFTLASQQWQISYTGNFTGNSFTGGNDLVIQAIPEPSTWALLAFSLTSVLVLRRRRGN